MVSLEGETAELVDLYAVRGDTLNVHASLTPRALVLPGERLSPRQEGLDLRRLRVSLEGEPPIPVLRDAAGRRLLPMHLGGAGPAFMPPLARLLTLFGPGPFRPVFPLRPTEKDLSGILRQDRLWCGPLLVQRRRWTVPVSAFPRISPQARGRVLELDGWRRAAELPPKIFVHEPRRHGPAGRRTKPQFIDFDSPQFCELFLQCMRDAANALRLEEAVPVPERYPEDSTATRWGVEVLIEGSLFPNTTLNLVSREVERTASLSIP
jgi:hypothetical protein